MPYLWLNSPKNKDIRNERAIQIRAHHGRIAVDMLPDGKKPGGAPANFVYHAAQNGVKATAVTAVGDDELGRELVQLLTERGVNVAAQTNEYATGITAVSLDENGVPLL